MSVSAMDLNLILGAENAECRFITGEGGSDESRSVDLRVELYLMCQMLPEDKMMGSGDIFRSVVATTPVSDRKTNHFTRSVRDAPSCSLNKNPT